MREIKFRGKRKDDGEWVFGVLSYCNFNYGVEYAISTRTELGSIFTSRIDQNTAGQYTGLKDKNGVEIYEGDLIKTDYASGIWVVAFDERYTCVSLFEAKQLSDKYIALSNRFQYDYEVVGNIYDNPELLF